MRLTAFTDLGLRALMRLAAEPLRSRTTEAIATEFRVSRHHLVKAVQALAQAGFVRTTRGVGGGIVLARPPAEIRLGDVVRVLERDQPLVECFRADGGDCALAPACRLKSMLGRAGRAFLAELDRHTLADCAYDPPVAPRPGGPAGLRRNA